MGDNRLSQETIALLRVANYTTICKLLKQELRDEKTLRVYTATDGKHTQTDIAAAAEVSQPRVSRLWNRWLHLGLLVKSKDGEVRSLFDPEVYGITQSTVAKKKPKGKANAENRE